MDHSFTKPPHFLLFFLFRKQTYDVNGAFAINKLFDNQNFKTTKENHCLRKINAKEHIIMLCHSPIEPSRRNSKDI